MLRNLFISGLALLLCAGLGGVYAASKEDCKPTTINFCERGSSLINGEYRVYTVGCSDGTQRTVTFWKTNKKWCIGNSDRCSASQLQAAANACKENR